MIEVEALVGIISLVALLLFLYGPWQAYCIDQARQALFAERAELFQIAHTGSVSFDSAAYIMVRKHIEKLIRFAHHLTWVRFVVILPLVRKLNIGDAPNATREIDNIENEHTKRAIQDIYDRSGYIMLRMIVSKSPLLFSLLMIAKAFFHGAKVLTHIVGRGNWRLQNLTTYVVQISQQTQVIIRVEADSSRY